jgi:hypothetical protein
MTTVISYPSGSSTPALVLGWESRQESRNIVHPIVGISNPDVTLRPANLRTGTLHLFYMDEASAESIRAAHTAGVVFSLSSDDVDSIDMSYVVDGEIGTRLDDQTRIRWIVDVDFQEVTI